MANETVLPVELLRNLIDYNPETGALTWRDRPDNRTGWSSYMAGKAALTAKNSNGYLSGAVLGESVVAHRVAWAIHSGSWPDQQIDHVNGDRADNRLVNLRAVSAGENLRNKALGKNNTSGVPGVVWCRTRRRWKARITVNYATISLGSHVKFEDAVAARKAAEGRYGFHENHGRPQRAS